MVEGEKGIENFLVSIIVPVFNIKDYISICIESLLHQTHSKIEIIIVDDGSTDGSSEIIDKYAEQDNRIISIHQNNKGPGAARNSGLEVMSGDYVMFVDGDDFVEIDFCEKALELVICEKVEIASFGYNLVWDDHRKVAFAIVNPRLVNKEDGIKKLIDRDDAVMNFVCNKIFDRHLFDGIRFPEKTTFEDMAIIHLLFDRVSSNIFISDLILYNYRQSRTGSTMSNVTAPKHLHNRLINEFERLKFIREKYPALVKNQQRWLVNICLLCFMFLPPNSPDIKEVKTFFNSNMISIISATSGLRKIRVLCYFLFPPLFKLINNYIKQRIAF